MYTPQHHGGISAPGSTVKKVPLNGLFKDGMWHCNCNPRLPATHFQVKKEGKNKGKWFYTCQESKENGCGFFLWDENAAGREMRAVMNNAGSEPEPSKSGAEGIRYKGLNTTWIENLGKADKLEDATVTEEYGRETIPGQPETPQKVAKTNLYMTPSTKRKRDKDSLLTPITARKDDFLSVPSLSRRYGSKSNDNEPFGRRNSAQTPTPKRFHDTEVAEAYDDTAQSYDTTDEVMSILKDQHIDEETASRLRALLNKHALRVSGIVKGRDISRVALKAKDAKIAELQQKITTLETEMEMDKTIIGHFKRDMTQSIASKRGRG